MLFLFSLLDYPQLIIGFVLGALCILLIVKVFFSLFGPRHYGGRYDRYPPYGGYGEPERQHLPTSSGCLPLIVLLLIGMVVLKYTLRSDEALQVVQKESPSQQRKSKPSPSPREAKKLDLAPRQEGLNRKVYGEAKKEAGTALPIKVLVPKPGQYFLQTNFFREVPNAESYCRALQNKGLPACIVERQGSRFWGYAACAGPYKSWEDAVNAKQAWGNDKWELFGEMDW